MQDFVDVRAVLIFLIEWVQVASLGAFTMSNKLHTIIAGHKSLINFVPERYYGYTAAGLH